MIDYINCVIVFIRELIGSPILFSLYDNVIGVEIKTKVFNLLRRQDSHVTLNLDDDNQDTEDG